MKIWHEGDICPWVVLFGCLSKVNKITKLILNENAEYGAASDSSGKGQNIF